MSPETFIDNCLENTFMSIGFKGLGSKDIVMKICEMLTICKLVIKQTWQVFV